MDPEYIYQIAPHLSVSPRYTFSTTDVRLDSDLEFTDDESLSGKLALRFNDPCHEAGIGVGYGPLALSLGMEIGKREDYSSSNSLRLFASRYGLQLRYSKVSESISGLLELAPESGIDPVDFTTLRPGKLKEVFPRSSFHSEPGIHTTWYFCTGTLYPSLTDLRTLLSTLLRPLS